MVRYVDKLGAQMEELEAEFRKMRPKNPQSPFITAINISNFRCFPENDGNDTFKISFNTPKDNKLGSGLTILIGENNSGKSTVLRAIGLFSQSDENLESMLARHELHASCVDDPEKGIEIYLNTSRGGFLLKNNKLR